MIGNDKLPCGHPAACLVEEPPDYYGEDGDDRCGRCDDVESARMDADIALAEPWILEAEQLRARVAHLETLINNPHNEDWLEGVRIEAAHQQERWASDHDAGKTPEDWLWLLGYLAGKCVRACNAGNVEKAKHHTISTAAVLLNWHRKISGEPGDMRPGIMPVGEVVTS